MYGVDDILDSIIGGMNDENEKLKADERWNTENERGGDPAHPLGPMVFQRVRSPDGRLFQLTVTEINVG